MAGHRRTAAIIIAMGAFVLFIGGGARFAIGLTLTAIEADLASGRSLIGAAVAVFQVVSAVAMLWAGRLADRMDPRHVLGLGVLVAGIGMAAIAGAWQPWQIVFLYGVMFGIGSGMASLIPIGVLVTRHIPERAGLANSIALAGMGIGQLVIMAALASSLSVVGWRAIYVWLGALHLAMVPLVVIVVGWAVGRAERAAGAGVAVAPAAPTGLSVGQAARTRRFWLLMAVYSLCGFQDFFVTTHIVAFAQDRGADIVLAGRLLALMGLMMLLGVLAAGWSADKIGPVAATLIAFLVRIAVFAAVLFDQSTWTVAIFALVFGATFLVTAPLNVLFVREAFGTRHLGALTGLVTMVHHIFGGIGGLVGAVLFDAQGSYDAVLWLMLASSTVAAVLTLGLRSRT